MSSVGLLDPDIYAVEPPFAKFAELRSENPVPFVDLPGSEGCWAVLRHADVMTVARRPRSFSAGLGGVLLDDRHGEALDNARKTLLAMDPPRHSEFRSPLSPSFAKRVVAKMEFDIRALCRAIFAEAVQRGDVDFVHDVTAKVPARVIATLMGIPIDDADYLHGLAEQGASVQDADVVPDVEAFDDAIEMVTYGREFAARRRREPARDDLTSLILRSEFAGSLMNDLDFGTFFVQLVIAGNETTKTMLSSGLFCLLENPGQLDDLRADPSLIPGAVEEMLRFANPLHYFRRTAAEAITLSGAHIEAGDKVAMMYTSANRDEKVFASPEKFDIRRRPNPHLSFGIGPHFCLGVHLARLEARVFFEELFTISSRIELSDAPVRIRSNLNNGFKTMPVRLTVSAA